MSVKIKNKKAGSILLLIAVMAVGLQDVSSGAIAPAIASIVAAFPSVSGTTIQLLVTLPNICIVVMAPLYGWLSTKIQPRKIIIFGLCMFSFGGMVPVFFNDIRWIMAARLLLGFGTGITMPSAIAIISAFYKGEMRAKLTGWNMAVGCLGCIFMQTLGGYFCEINWHYSFLAYCIGIVSLILVLLFLPKVPMAAPEKREKGKSIFKQIPGAVYITAFAFFVGLILACIVSTNISLQIENEGIGTPSNSGNALSVFIAGSFVSALFCSRIEHIFGDYVRAVSWFVMGIGFLITSLGYTLPTIIIGMLIIGLGQGIAVPTYYNRVSQITALPFVAFSVAMISAANGLGNFIVPFVINVVCRIFHQELGRFPIFFGSIGLFALAIIVAVFTVVNTKKEKGRARVPMGSDKEAL